MRMRMTLLLSLLAVSFGFTALSLVVIHTSLQSRSARRSRPIFNAPSPPFTTCKCSAAKCCAAKRPCSRIYPA